MSIRSAYTGALIVLLVLTASLGQAETPAIPSRLTLKDAIRLAIARNPALEAEKNEIQALEGDSIAAGKRPNPVVSLQTEDYALRAHPGSFFSSQAITLQFDYEIERGGRRRLRAEAAGLAVEAQQLAYQDRVRSMQLDVERAFTLAVLAKSNLDAAQLLLAQTDRVISLNRVRFEQGEISALELNRTEAEKLRFQEDYFQADLILRNAKSSLLALLHASDLSADVHVDGALQTADRISEPGLPPQAPLAELLRIAFERRPDIAARLKEKKRAEAETLLQRANRSPNITVGGGYKRNAADNSFVLGVAFPLKIFNRNEGGIIRAGAEQLRNGNLVEAVRKEIELDVQQAYNAAEVSRQRVEYIRTQHMNKAGEVSRITLASYNLGGATLIDYLDAQRTYRDTMRTYNQALYDERISLYELANAIGMGVE